MCVFDGPKPAPSDDPWQRFASISKKAGDLGDDPAGWNRGNKGTTEQVELVERDDYIEVQSMVARNHAFSPESLPLKGIVKAEEKSRWAMIGTQDARCDLSGSLDLLLQAVLIIIQWTLWVHNGEEVHSNAH